LSAYLKQQVGYGEAEALLIGKHPEHFSSFGGGIWHGRIYASSYCGLLLRRAIIYHGVFGSGFFQRLYTPDPVQPLLICTSLGYHVCLNVPLLLLANYFDALLPLAVASLGMSVAVCALAAAQARLPRHRRRLWSRPLVALLFFLQPIVRGWARFKWRFNLRSGQKQTLAEPLPSTEGGEAAATRSYWTDRALERCDLIEKVLSRLNQTGWTLKTDTGWMKWDVEIPADPWTRLTLTAVSEELGQGKRNFHWRIGRFWSLPAKALFWMVVGAVAALILMFAEAVPWAWMGLLALPLAGWVFDERTQEYEWSIRALLDTVAQENGMVKFSG
jgi:hypothetical protein